MTELQIGKIDEPETEFRTARPAAPPRNQKKRWKKILLASVGAVALIGLAVGGIVWSKRGVVAVQTGKVVRQDLTALVTANGDIEPPQGKYANVNANSFGKVTAIYVQEGDRVKKGQLLLRTEDVQQTATMEAQQAALKSSLADVQALEAGVESSAASLKTSQADLLTAEANYNRAKDDYARGQQLLKDQLIAQQVYDQRRNDYEVAQANVDAAKARVAQAKALYTQAVYNRDMARTRVAQARANLVGATDAHDKTIYVAPFDGIITSLPVHMGENVVMGIQNAAGSVLYQVSDLSVITAVVMVDETDIVNVKLGQTADVAIDAIPNKTFKGKVTEIGQSALTAAGLQAGQSGTSNEQAKDFKVSITLDDPPPGLRPGLSATAKITTATRKDAVTIPLQALAIRTRAELEESKKAEQGKGVAAAAAPMTPQQKEKAKEEVQGVFVLKEGRVNFVPVETGIMSSTDAEVLKGIQPGDTIVTGSYQALRSLKNGTKVKVDNSGLGPPTGGVK